MLKNSVKIALTTILLVLGTVSYAQKKVFPLPADSTVKLGQNYFFYALPQTTFQVEVIVNKVSEMKGNYADYAEKLLGLTNIITQNRTSYELKSVKIQAFSTADVNAVFAVELSAAQLKNNFLASLYARQNPYVQPVSAAYEPQEVVIPDFFRYYSDLAYTEESNDYVETQIVDGVVRQVKASKVQKVNKSDAQKASEAADMISKIRSDRYDLLTGAQEVNYSKDALELMSAKLDELEKNYIGLFTGFVVNNEEHYTISVTPQRIQEVMFLFSFSPQTGFSTKKSADESENYYLNFKAQHELSVCRDFNAQRESAAKKTRDGYRVRRALPVNASLITNAKVVADFGTQHVFQFGWTETLPLKQDALEIDKFVIVY